MIKKIGVITSGGDCGGLNAVVKGAATVAIRHGITPYVIPHGYAGLYNLANIEKLVELNYERLDNVNIGLAGSDAGHSRVKVSKIKDPDKYAKIKNGLKKFGIQALLISGGDDTGSVVVDLADHGIQCVHAPKTMDLDLQSYSVGGDSAINRITTFANDLKTTGKTHNRILVLEVFGRYYGHTAFRAGIASNADCILIPEIAVNFDVVYEHMLKTFFRRIEGNDVGSGTYLIIVSEGMKGAEGQHLTLDDRGTDAFGHKALGGAGEFVAKYLEKRMKEDQRVKDFMKKRQMFVEGQYESPEVRAIRPTHLVRSGATTAYDANFGMVVGAACIHLLRAGKSGVTVVDVDGDQLLYVPTIEAIKPRQVHIDHVSFLEEMGFCFGRANGNFQPRLVAVEGQVRRFY